MQGRMATAGPSITRYTDKMHFNPASALPGRRTLYTARQLFAARTLSLPTWKAQARTCVSHVILPSPRLKLPLLTRRQVTQLSKVQAELLQQTRSRAL